MKNMLDYLSKMLGFLNQVWTVLHEPSGEIFIVADDIWDNTPTGNQQKIASIIKYSDNVSLIEINAKLIAHAPDMFRTLCNVAGEVEYGDTSLPDEIMNDIRSLVQDIRDCGKGD